MLGYASDVQMDNNGRILFPAPLRDFAMLVKAAYLVGQGNKFEIWDGDLWNARCGQWLKEGLKSDVLSVEMEQLTL